MTRQELFKLSLIQRGISVSKYARMLEVTPTYIHTALAGGGSPSINSTIDNFIKTNIPELIERLNEAVTA